MPQRVIHDYDVSLSLSTGIATMDACGESCIFHDERKMETTWKWSIREAKKGSQTVSLVKILTTKRKSEGHVSNTDIACQIINSEISTDWCYVRGEMTATRSLFNGRKIKRSERTTSKELEMCLNDLYAITHWNGKVQRDEEPDILDYIVKLVMVGNLPEYLSKDDWGRYVLKEDIGFSKEKKTQEEKRLQEVSEEHFDYNERQII